MDFQDIGVRAHHYPRRYSVICDPCCIWGALSELQGSPKTGSMARINQVPVQIQDFVGKSNLNSGCKVSQSRVLLDVPSDHR